jgi:enamine deaminase RidA (YjgF/YER057c/UK114 family)
MNQVTILDPGWTWTKRARMTAGVRVGNIIYTSGLVAYDREGRLIGPGDAKAQTRQIFSNLSELLAEAHASLEDIIKITTFLTDLDYYSDFAAVRAETFPNTRPVGTTVGTSALAAPEFLVEIEAIAMINRD